MKLVILGATGPTGRQLISQALPKGHEITCIVRDPLKINIKHERLNIITGDIFENGFLSGVFKNNDIILSALGAGKSLKSDSLLSRAMNVIIPAMQNAGLRRIIFLSAFGVGESFSQASFIQKLAFRIFLKNIYADKVIADDLLSKSRLEWTIVRPVLLTDRAFTGKYKASEKMKMKGMPKISRADVAHFMICETGDKKWLNKKVILSFIFEKNDETKNE